MREGKEEGEGSKKEIEGTQEGLGGLYEQGDSVLVKKKVRATRYITIAIELSDLPCNCARACRVLLPQFMKPGGQRQGTDEKKQGLVYNNQGWGTWALANTLFSWGLSPSSFSLFSFSRFSTPYKQHGSCMSPIIRCELMINNMISTQQYFIEK